MTILDRAGLDAMRLMAIHEKKKLIAKVKAIKQTCIGLGVILGIFMFCLSFTNLFAHRPYPVYVNWLLILVGCSLGVLFAIIIFAVWMEVELQKIKLE